MSQLVFLKGKNSEKTKKHLAKEHPDYTIIILKKNRQTRKKGRR